jgi:mono/diheme cytochrome c family protein
LVARLVALVAIGALLLAAPVSSAAEPVLTIELGGTLRHFSRSELLRDPTLTMIEIPRDVAYGKAMRYRALPLAHLLSGFNLPRDQILESVASDGFVGLLPVDLVLHPKPGQAEAYLALEPPDAPWPLLPGGKLSAGPFYIVWLHPEASGVRSELWPYQVATIRNMDSPARRWPALAVDPALPADDPVRAGQALFVAQCLVCHKMNGAGSATLGPDLNLPENPTQYFLPAALHRYIREPAALRHWPGMQMKGFSPEALSDREIDLIIAYLTHMAGRKISP